MILYGAIKNSFTLLLGSGTSFTIKGAVLSRSGPEATTAFPIYGSLITLRNAPNKFTLLGPVKVNRNAPQCINMLGAVRSFQTLSPNISGLVISDIDAVLTFNTPSTVYNIYPYYSSDVKTIIGTTLPHRIVERNLLFDTLPEGPIHVIPFHRLQVYANEIRQLTVVNTIPNRLEFTHINVSGDFLFSLNSTGPWTNSLDIVNTFYVKAPNITLIGSNFSQEFTVTATAIPIG